MILSFFCIYYLFYLCLSIKNSYFYSLSTDSCSCKGSGSKHQGDVAPPGVQTADHRRQTREERIQTDDKTASVHYLLILILWMDAGAFNYTYTCIIPYYKDQYTDFRVSLAPQSDIRRQVTLTCNRGHN